MDTRGTLARIRCSALQPARAARIAIDLRGGEPHRPPREALVQLDLLAQMRDRLAINAQDARALRASLDNTRVTIQW